MNDLYFENNKFLKSGYFTYQVVIVSLFAADVNLVVEYLTEDTSTSFFLELACWYTFYEFLKNVH